MQIKSTLLAACLCAAAPLTSTPTSYTIPIYTGYNLIANQLDAGANTFNQVMPTVPHGTTVWLWDYGNNTFCQAEIFYQGAGWLPNGTWLRGRGGFLQSGVPTYSLAFNGTLNPPVFPPSVPQGFSIIGRQIPSTPTVWDDIAGGPPWLGLDGTTLFRFMQPAGNYADA